MFRFAFGKLRGLLECQAAFFAVQTKEAQHRFGMRGKIQIPPDLVVKTQAIDIVEVIS